MRTRALRMVGLLFGLSMMLTACDASDILDLLGGGAPEPPAAEESENPEPDPVSNESDPVSDESEVVEEPGDDHEHQCYRADNDRT